MTWSRRPKRRGEEASSSSLQPPPRRQQNLLQKVSAARKVWVQLSREKGKAKAAFLTEESCCCFCPQSARVRTKLDFRETKCDSNFRLFAKVESFGFSCNRGDCGLSGDLARKVDSPFPAVVVDAVVGCSCCCWTLNLCGADLVR